MKLGTNHPKSPESKPDEKDDLKSLPMPEVEKKLGVVSGWPQSSRSGKAVDLI